MTSKIDKAIRGKRAAFFDNPDTDRLLAMLMRFMTEYWTLKERVLTLEALLINRGILDAEAIDEFRPDPTQDQDWDRQSFEFIQAVIEAARNIEEKS